MKKPKGCRAWRRSRRAGRPEEEGGLGGTTFAMLASRFAFPVGPLRGASSELPSALVVSSDLCGAQPRLITADKAALTRGKNGRRRSIALQGFR